MLKITFQVHHAVRIQTQEIWLQKPCSNPNPPSPPSCKQRRRNGGSELTEEKRPEWPALDVYGAGRCGDSVGGPRQKPGCQQVLWGQPYASLLTFSSTPCYSQAPLLACHPIL